jgi:glyoxylase-like metal-dependent hydrolase (beta-lactamase superfamily II)
MFNQKHLLYACFATAGFFTNGHSKPIQPHTCQAPAPIQVKPHINLADGLDVVSSLIIGSQAAVIIDLPWTIPKAKELAEWVKQTTNKPIIAAFTTHSHPDHYLSGGAFLEEFPGIKYYANPKAAEVIKNEAPGKV